MSVTVRAFDGLRDVEQAALGAWLAARQPDKYADPAALAPASQGRGYGRALLAQTQARLQAAGATRLVLTVGDGNAGALALYRKSGFAAERIVTQWHVRTFEDP